ncbi:hypothetical protein G7Y89_g5189 [Cudoniella acicularis]|uniref:JmjC domain-containing protein n=1 Tax=Cudoniella acicularis TaxID=354080 RepID=A0A8H4RPH9_9HELO|nr:hypothetical protein G7Y89_g5189 [Cudoniella acicularis]
MLTKIKRAERASSGLKLRISCSFERLHTLRTLPAVESLSGPLDAVDIDEFRLRAFIPETPLLITTKSTTNGIDLVSLSDNSIPATNKWFHYDTVGPDGGKSGPRVAHEYLSPFDETILPYEYILHSQNPNLRQLKARPLQDIFITSLVEKSPKNTFHRFNAPLALFLEACRPPKLPKLYIAQAQIVDLPKELQDDLPTPRIVKEAGRGDIYDRNIWLGIPRTFTPLHKDPNPNLFVQLAGTKRVRLFKPSIGRGIFWEVQQKIGQHSSSSLRGEEMMEGTEFAALNDAVWRRDMQYEGFEVSLSAGDALFIPKGFWHSIKSVGRDITASVNWWFR